MPDCQNHNYYDKVDLVVALCLPPTHSLYCTCCLILSKSIEPPLLANKLGP